MAATSKLRRRLAQGGSGALQLLAGAFVCLSLGCSGGSDDPGVSGDPVTSPMAAGANAPPQPDSSAAGTSAGAASAGSPSQPAPSPTTAGSGGVAAPPPGSTPDAGQPVEPSPDAGRASDAAMAPAGGPVLPPVSDPGESGSFTTQVVETLPGLSTHVLIAPQELGRDGIKHPVLVWTNGAGAGYPSYVNMLDNLAAQGFFVLDDKQSTFDAHAEIDSQQAAMDWVVEQAQNPNSPYYGKIDATRIAIAGHSLGSVASFGNVGDPRIVTSIHIAGGVIGNPGGVDAAHLQDLHAPAAFLCGSQDTNGLPRVREDFASAPADVPVYFGILAGVGHVGEFSESNGGRWGRVVAAWLRWQLADDDSMEPLFAGADCEFCSGDWTAMKRGLD